MVLHPGNERRRFPRVTLPSPSNRVACAAMVRPRLSPLEQAMSALGGLRGLFDRPIVISGLAGLGLAVCGGVTFVAVRRAINGAPPTPRSGDALAT